MMLMSDADDESEDVAEDTTSDDVDSESEDVSDDGADSEADAGWSPLLPLFPFGVCAGATQTRKQKQAGGLLGH